MTVARLGGPVAFLMNRRFDLLAAGLGLLLAALMFPLRFLVSNVFVATLPLVLGGACVLYLVTAYWGDGEGEFLALPSAVARVLPGFALAGTGLMVAVATYTGSRSVGFHVLAAVVGSVLLAQVLLSRDADFRLGLFLAQLVVFAFVLRLAALYTTPGFVGIDVWTHVNLTESILGERSLSAIDQDKYFASPLYHLYLAAASYLYGLPLRESLFLSLGLVMPFACLLVYGAASLLVEPRWAALAALLYSVGDYVVQWSIHLIPTSLGLLFYLVVLYALIRVTRTEYSLRDYALLLLASVAIILTHQVSSFIMLVTLGSAIVGQVIIRLGLLDPPDAGRSLVSNARDPTNLAGLFVFDFGFIVFMWSLTPFEGDTFLETVLSYLRETLVSSAGFLNLAGGESSSSGGGAGAAPDLLDTVALYVDTLGFLLLLFVAFLGCLYVVNRRRSEQAVVTLLLATAAMLVFVMGLPIFGIRNFIPTRWYAFLYGPMALLGVLGIRYIVRELDPRVLVAVLLVFTLTFPGAMLLSSDATVDNPVFEDRREELAYNAQELAAASAIGEMTGSPSGDEIRPDQVVYTDHPYQTVIQRQRMHITDAIELNGSGPAEHDITVYRRAQSTEATYFSVNGSGQVMNVPRTRVCRPGQNVLYANGEVVVCTLSG